MKSLILIILFSLSIVSCADTDTETAIRQAEMAVAQGDMVMASSIAEKLTQDKNLSGLSATQLARLSLVYIQISDSLDYEDNLLKATDLYKRAHATQSDSAKAFFENVEYEKQSYVDLLSRLTESADHSNLGYNDTSAEELTDSEH